MIKRTEDGVLITPEDIAPLAGIMGGFRSHWEDTVKEQVPGSFRGFALMVEDFMDRMEKVLDTPPES